MMTAKAKGVVEKMPRWTQNPDTVYMKAEVICWYLMGDKEERMDIFT